MPSKAITVFPNVKAISKKDLLDFIRQYINPQFEAIEDLRTGADFCIGMKVLFPETISLQAIKFGPDLSNISIYNNFKQLQSAFDKVGVEKDVPMDSIMQGNFQANFYFGQWFMGFFFANYAGQVYNPMELRKYKKNRVNNLVSGGGGGSSASLHSGKLPFFINFSGRFNYRDRFSSPSAVSVSSQTDESYLMDEAKYTEQEHYVEELRLETSDLQEVIKYLHDENKKLATAIDCTNSSTQLFFAKLEKIEKLCEKERQNSLRTAVESALYADLDQ